MFLFFLQMNHGIPRVDDADLEDCIFRVRSLEDPWG